MKAIFPIPFLFAMALLVGVSFGSPIGVKDNKEG
jgi:hypothetical protein